MHFLNFDLLVMQIVHDVLQAAQTKRRERGHPCGSMVDSSMANPAALTEPNTNGVGGRQRMSEKGRVQQLNNLYFVSSP
jgi:hypothetical protein